MAIGPDGKLYVTNGNSTDDGVLGGDPEVEPWSGAVIRIDPAATNVSVADLQESDALVATGMRNIFDVAFSPYDGSKLFIPMNGVDDAGAGATPGLEDSDDLLYLTDSDDMRIVGHDENGEPILEPVIDHFGFPSCLYNEARKGNLEPYDNPNPSVIARFGACPVADVPRPAGTFGLHVSADGMAFQTSDFWGADYKNDGFVAEFGNFSGDEVVGHRVVRVELSPDGEKVVRHSEFLTGPAPLDVTFGPEGSLFVADFGGTIYKVMKVADVPREITVNIQAFQFAPQALTVPEGTTVTWLNNETALALPHNVAGQFHAKADGTTGDGAEINSPTLTPGKTHSFRFETPGTFVYTCTVNATHTALMHGTITVLPAGN
jgi:glucose/arabinose dehydrogenase